MPGRFPAIQIVGNRSILPARDTTRVDIVGLNTDVSDAMKRSSTIQLVLIEDDDLDAEIVVRALRTATPRHGVATEEFALKRYRTIAEAVDQIPQSTPDVMLVDIHLPDCQGMDTITHILDVAVDTPVIALTGMDDEQFAIDAVRTGAADYLNKSQVTRSSLRRSIYYAIERRQFINRLKAAEREQVAAKAAQKEAEARAKAADDLRKARDAAEAANIAKSEFLANMSHELRTPLHGILSFARLGHRRHTFVGSEKIGRYFAQIASSGEVLLELLNDLLDLSKLEANAMNFELQPTNLKKQIICEIDQLNPLAAEKRIHVQLDANRDLPQIAVDTRRINQVVRNLLSNAIKFSPAGSEVKVVLRQRRDSQEIVVIDEGLGIPLDETEKIFSKFSQSSATKSTAGGTGLGLSICREIVRGHNGTITAENRHPHGAVFRVRLPQATFCEKAACTC